jgi:hypothetical protein
MGLFDFFKKQVDPWHNIRNNPEMRPLIVETETTQLVAQCQNLTAVGRQSEAKALALKYLVDLSRLCLKPDFLNSNIMLMLLATAATKLGEPKEGKILLEKLIAFHIDLTTKQVPGAPTLDLTDAYISAGKLAHQIRESRDDEYRCYWLATEALPPPGCKAPASNRSKARAHDFAYALCKNEQFNDPNTWSDRTAWHDAKRREFAPECNWDDLNSRMAWLGLR